MLISVLICFQCWGAPDWPVDGQVDQNWVQASLEWRLRRGLDECVDWTVAMDAWTLEWISSAASITVDLRSEDWPVLRQAPELMHPLIQIHALAILQGRPLSVNEVHRKLRRIARRTEAIPFRTVREALR